MPIKVKYQNSAGLLSIQENVVTILIVREATNKDSKGIGISQFVVGPYTGF